MKMAARKRKIFQAVLYVLYAVTLISVLLAVFFPSGKIRRFCETEMARTLPGTTCVISSISYDFPLTLRFRNIRLYEARQPGNLLISITGLSVSKEIGRTGWLVKAELYSGSCRGRLVVDRRSGTVTLTDVMVRHLDLDRWHGLQRLLGRNLSGELELAGRYSGKIGRILDGEATGRARLHDGSLELLRPILSVAAVDVRKSSLNFTFRNKTLTIGEGRFFGKEFDGSFSGVFHVAFPWDHSMLRITGGLTPTSSLIGSDRRWQRVAALLRRRYQGTTLPFVVSGTVAAPFFRFGG